MRLFVREQNELADRIGRSNLTVYLHTAEPTDGNPANGRVTVGGGTYETGATYAFGDISNASGGDITFNADIAFGTADEADGHRYLCHLLPGGQPHDRTPWATSRCPAPR